MTHRSRAGHGHTGLKFGNRTVNAMVMLQQAGITL